MQSSAPKSIILAIAVACGSLFLSIEASTVALAQRPPSAGAYKDKSGNTHAWSISPTHALSWDGAAYFPVGGTFSPRYLAEAATDENWNRDIAALKVIKSKGVSDLLINPVRSAVDIAPEYWQRVINYLDKEGFTYGISFGAGLVAPLSGFVVKPTSYRVEGVRENADTNWNVSNADTAYYLFVDGNDAEHVTGEGIIRARDGIASVQAGSRLNSDTIGILYPHKIFAGSRESALPDVWSAFDKYRDAIINKFALVKFGAGLRFFLDPLAHALSLQGEIDHSIPDSNAFRLEWEAWLTSHYPTIEDVMNAWSMQERNITDFRQAARLIPLHSGGRGVPFLLDTETTKRLQDKGGDRIWFDLRECRNDSLVYYMNAVADILKRNVAEVPVVYTRTHQHRIFSNQQKGGGFDGLGIAAYARGSRLVTDGADSVYSQADESLRPVWCIVTETQDTLSPSKSQMGYASKQSMFYDLDWLKGIGAKGFFVNGFQVLPEVLYKNFQLVNAPEQIEWLKEYGDRLRQTVSMDRTRPSTLPFPPEAAGIVKNGPIGGGGVWWVPSLATGKILQFGSSYAGYTINLPDGEITVMWSLRGTRNTHLVVADPRKVTITTADGQPVVNKLELKKKTIALIMNDLPIILKGADAEMYPVEAAQDALLELKTLIQQAEDNKVPTSDYKLRLDRAQSSYNRGDVRLALNMAGDTLGAVVNALQPYSWIEAERAERHTFSEISQNSAASNFAFLLLSTSAKPGASGYGAEYRFTVPADDTYYVWAAISPAGPQTSQFVWIVDSTQPRQSSEAVAAGSPYMSNQFQWSNLGRVALKKGPHAFTLRITDPATGTGAYAFAADAFLITRSTFVPNGTARPAMATFVDPPKNKKNKKDAKSGTNSK